MFVSDVTCDVYWRSFTVVASSSANLIIHKNFLRSYQIHYYHLIIHVYCFDILKVSFGQILRRLFALCRLQPTWVHKPQQARPNELQRHSRVADKHQNGSLLGQFPTVGSYDYGGSSAFVTARLKHIGHYTSRSPKENHEQCTNAARAHVANRNATSSAPTTTTAAATTTTVVATTSVTTTDFGNFYGIAVICNTISSSCGMKF